MRTLIPGFATPLEYPSSDSQPMTESDLCWLTMVDLINRLTTHFAEREDMYVTRTYGGWMSTSCSTRPKNTSRRPSPAAASN
jgi:hypothetical protein